MYNIQYGGVCMFAIVVVIDPYLHVIPMQLQDVCE
jgi:hypothetical protein